MRTARRTILLGALASSGSIALAACGGDDSATRPDGSPTPSELPEPTTPPSSQSPSESDTTVPEQDNPSRVLLAYFSRSGENYYYGDRVDLKVGNTKVLAGMIAERIGCDLHEIEAAEPYSDDYDATVQRNVEEQDADARPEIANDLPSLDQYDVILLASPIWNVRPPMIMKTFSEGLDFTGKTVHPVVTYAVSEMGTAERDYRDACPGADLGRGLAVQGEEVAEAGNDIDRWLAQVGLTPA